MAVGTAVHSHDAAFLTTDNVRCGLCPCAHDQLLQPFRLIGLCPTRLLPFGCARDGLRSLMEAPVRTRRLVQVTAVDIAQCAASALYSAG